MYTFNDKVKDGIRGAKELDLFYSKWFKIESVDLQIDKLGIDRIFVERVNNFRWTVEYKTDLLASSTKNAFIETISVDTTNTPGWAYTACAQLLLYYLPSDKKVIRLTMYAIKHLVDEWKGLYPTKPSPNEGKEKKGYRTFGVCVPLDIFMSYGLVDYIL